MCEWKWWWEGSCAASSWRRWRSLVAWTSSRTWMWSCATLATPSAGAATLSCREPRCCLHRRRPPHRSRTNTVSLSSQQSHADNSGKTKQHLLEYMHFKALQKMSVYYIFDNWLLLTISINTKNYLISTRFYFILNTRVKRQVNAFYLHNSIVLIKVLELWVSGLFDLFLTKS